MKKNIAKKYYYALMDNQMGCMVSTGFNETSRDIVRSKLVNYLLLGNFSEEGEVSLKNNSLEELLNYYEFTLLKSDTPFNDELEKKLDFLI